MHAPPTSAALPVAANRLAAMLLAVGLVAATLAALSISVMSAARAYVAGEGQWSQAQKSAVGALLLYIETGEARHHEAWRQEIAVPLGDRRAREALDAEPPDLAAAADGFLAGRNHPADIPRMIRLYRCCHALPFMDDAVDAWREADRGIQALVGLAAEAESLHRERPLLGAAEREALRSRVLALDLQLTPLARRFSARLGEASRLVATLLSLALPGGALLVGAGGFAWVRARARREQAALSATRRIETLRHSLWATTDDTVLIVDGASRIRFANPATATLFGHEPAALEGQPLALLIPERLREAHAAGMARHLASGEKRLDWRGTRIVGLHADGRERPIEIRFGRIELDGEPLFVGFVRDIAAVVEAEQAVQRSREQLEQAVAERTQELVQANQRLRELDRLKSEFLASMSHELRTPLNSVLGFATVLELQMAGPLNDEQRRQVGFIRGSGEHLLALITDVLDLSRIESGRMELVVEDFDLHAVAAEAVAQLMPLAQKKALALRLEMPPSLPMRNDRRRMLQVLLNLAGNAIKFTERGGVRLVAGAEGERVWIEVHDTGIGIAAEQLSQLFEAFRQLDGGLARPHEGTGLGLHLSRRLLALMQGTVSASSRPGEGSVFRVELPRAPTPESP